MKPNAYAATCPTRQILDRVGDKWAVLILLLIREEPMRFNALRRAIEGISQKMLSQVLKSLERDGLIRRRAIPTVPVTVEYSITPLGKTLANAVDPLRDWAERNLKEVLAAQRRYDAQKEVEGGVSCCGVMQRLSVAFILRDARKCALLRMRPCASRLQALMLRSAATPRVSKHEADCRSRVGRRSQNCPALASSTSTRSSISDSTASRPGSPEDDFRAAAASRSRFTVEVSKLPAKQPDLEIVEHIERAAAARHRALAPLDRILIDALQRKQRVDIASGLWRCSGACLLRGRRIRQRKAGRRGAPGIACRRPQRRAIRSVDAHGRGSREKLWRKDRPVMVNDA